MVAFADRSKVGLLLDRVDTFVSGEAVTSRLRIVDRFDVKALNVDWAAERIRCDGLGCTIFEVGEGGGTLMMWHGWTGAAR